MEEKELSPLDIMFQDQEQEAPEVIEEVEQEEEIPEQEEIVEEEEEESEADYEAPIKKPAPKKDAEEEEVEKLPPSKAVERAKAEGKRRKELEAEKQAWELERDRLTEELETYKSETTALKSVRVKPEEHPDFISLRDEIIRDAKDTVDDFEAPNKGVVYSKLGTFISKYREADKAEDRDAKLAILKDDLAAQMFGDETTWELLEKDDRKEVTAAIKLIKSSTAKADKLEALKEDLDKRSKSGTLALGVKEYEAVAKEFQPVLETIGDLPEEVIEANPYSVESKVAQLAKIPEGKKKLEKAKKEIAEIIFGSKPLTQAEIEKIEKNGGSVKEFIALDQKRIHSNRLKLLPMLVQSLVIRGETKEAFEELAKLKLSAESEQSEDDALLRITKKKAPKVEEKPTKSPVDIMFS